ncbi:MAG: cobyrinate a,c-diamide synthase [Acidimicrobiales bacterium]
MAGTHSGVGKTTVATGVMSALRARGLRVGSAKVGPDFIDPSYHALATGRPGRNLDAYLSDSTMVAGLAARAASGSDVLVVEGVMGLFDGSGTTSVDGSTAAISVLLGAPVILVVDASAMSGSVAALVHGFATYRPDVRLGGVVLNQVGSPGHATLLREALAPLGIPVLGVLARDDALVWRERHLGLVPVAEDPASARASVARLGDAVERALDLDAFVALARSAATVSVADPPRARFQARCDVAVCAGPAFSFVYPENLELLEQAGARCVPFDPLEAPAIPEGCRALYAGGGFPEVFAAALGENRPLLADVRRRVAGGLVTWAECGGYLWLCESLDGVAMAGVLEGAHATMTDRLTLGYREAVARHDSVLGPAGTVLRGHEYHRSVVSPPGEGLELTGRFGGGRAGYVSGSLVASYLHQHLSAAPTLAERFVAAAAGSPALPAVERS